MWLATSFAYCLAGVIGPAASCMAPLGVGTLGVLLPSFHGVSERFVNSIAARLVLGAPSPPALMSPDSAYVGGLVVGVVFPPFVV